jgi:hypothetical protein
MEEPRAKGSYDNDGVIWHQHSNHLMLKILEFFPKSFEVLDLGCGHNFYVTVLRYCGYTANGMDAVDLGSNYFYKQDLTKPLPTEFTGRYYNVISLEVGEHIPAEYEDAYLNNITCLGGDVIMSWAVPGQAGIGHINCRSNEWVIEQMAKRGYRFNEERTASLREAVKNCHCSWFRNTLMYFKCV